ncbi:MAG: hypothetical protein ACLQG3_08590 [Terracidiphilus sp.]
MRLTYTLTLEDFKAARSLEMRRTFGRWMVWAFTSRVVPVLAIACAACAVVFYLLDRREFFVECLAAGAVLLALSIAIPAARANSAHKSYREMFPSPDSDRSATIEIGDERIVFTTPGAGEQKVLWTEVEQVVEDAKISLICVTANRSIPFPGYALTREEREELGATIERHLGKRESC